jgi:hypothetical protein
MLKLLALLAISFLGSCVAPHLHRLPMYDECAKIAPVGETRYLRSSEISPDTFPAMIPYALITIENANSVSECERCVEDLSGSERPDVLLMGEPATVFAGTVGGAAASGGVAFGYAAPVYGQSMAACCYRISPVRLGFICDADGMVIALEDSCRKSGIIEGDKLLSIDGAPITRGKDLAKSAHFHKLLTMKPGDEAKLVWIRPGTGRMEGSAVCLENPPSYLTLSDARKERLGEQAERQGMNAAHRPKSDF